MAWRWISTPLSAGRGELSVLAIVETIFAISISLGIAWKISAGIEWHVVEFILFPWS